MFLYSSAVSIFAASEAVQITEAGRRGVSRLVADAEAGHTTVLRRRAEPVAAVVSYRDVQRLADLERDLTDVALVLARAASDSGNRSSLDDVIASYGYTRQRLASMEDPV
jgi:antitoxin (DNA-binding transcriptional repressor) of toxin-antitoxin stability system